MKPLLIILLLCSCVYYVPVTPVTGDDPERAATVLADSGYTDVYITGECWKEMCDTCFSTGFIARYNDSLVAGCVCENIYEYGINPRIYLEEK